MAKLIQIQVVTVPLSSATGPVGTAEVMYALDDTGRIWRLDPRIQPAAWHQFDAPPLSIP